MSSTTLDLLVAINRADLAGFTHFAAALRVLLKSTAAADHGPGVTKS